MSKTLTMSRFPLQPQQWAAHFAVIDDQRPSQRYWRLARERHALSIVEILDLLLTIHGHSQAISRVQQRRIERWFKRRQAELPKERQRLRDVDAAIAAARVKGVTWMREGFVLRWRSELKARRAALFCWMKRRAHWRLGWMPRSKPQLAAAEIAEEQRLHDVMLSMGMTCINRCRLGSCWE